MQLKHYSFDEFPERKGTNCYKYDRMAEVFGSEDVLALWVADMDFRTPDFVMDAIRKRCEHEVLGYQVIQEGWYSSIQDWLKKRYGLTIEKEELGFVPGIVAGIALCLQCFTKPGDKVLIQTPVYHPFMHVPQSNGREVVVNQLQYQNRRIEIDFEDFEAKAASGCKAFILCSPHNPGGRIWTQEELKKMLAICRKYDILVISDEIHADLSLPGHQHHPTCSVCECKDEKIISLMAPSKTFNIPGLSSSFYLIRNQELRKKFAHFLQCAELSNGNIFAFVAPEAAYRYGEDWLRQLTDYLQGNVDYIDGFLNEHLPSIEACLPEASFLIWLDCRKLGLNRQELDDLFIRKARLGINPGHMYGAGGDGFIRLNIGCPRSVLQEAMSRLKTAVDAVMS